MANDKLIVGVKYCGHCNPQKEGARVIQELQEQLPWVSIVKWQDAHDVLLIVSACPTGCAARPITSDAWIEVVVSEVRNISIPEGHPAEKIVNAFNALGFQFHHVVRGKLCSTKF